MAPVDALALVDPVAVAVLAATCEEEDDFADDDDDDDVVVVEVVEVWSPPSPPVPEPSSPQATRPAAKQNETAENIRFDMMSLVMSKGRHRCRASDPTEIVSPLRDPDLS